MSDLVTLDELAEVLGVHRTSARRIAVGLGMLPSRHQRRDLGHHQRVLTWTTEQVDQIIAERQRQGFEVCRP